MILHPSQTERKIRLRIDKLPMWPATKFGAVLGTILGGLWAIFYLSPHWSFFGLLVTWLAGLLLIVLTLLPGEMVSRRGKSRMSQAVIWTGVSLVIGIAVVFGVVALVQAMPATRPYVGAMLVFATGFLAGGILGLIAFVAIPHVYNWAASGAGGLIIEVTDLASEMGERTVDGVLLNSESGTLLRYPANPQSYYGIPWDVRRIGHGAFKNCKGLQAVGLPPIYPLSIEDDAFEGAGLFELNIPSKVTSIGKSAFASCRDLATLEFSDGEETLTIADGAFAFCGLRTVSLPARLESLGAGVFKGCDELTAIDVSSDNSSYASIDGVLFTKDLATLVAYPPGRTAPYVVPEGTCSIGDEAFVCNNSDNLEVILPQSLKRISDRAFANAEISTIELPESLESIGDSAFQFCRKLSSLCFPKCLSSFGRHAFSPSGLLNITVAEENPFFKSLDGVVLA